MENTPNSSLKLSQNVLKLIQPDLLTVEELVIILKERCVDSSLLSQSKEKLVSLFKNVALPLPQREHRNNYRGNLLTELRKKKERKRIVVRPSDDENKTFSIGINEADSSSKRPVEQKCDRLKPPPDLINSERRKIRLNSNSRSSQSQSSASSDLDKVVIKKRKTSESIDSSSEKINSVNNDKSETVRLSSSGSEDKNPDKCNGSKHSAPKKISLKRTHLTSTSSVSSTDSTPEKSPSEPDKKRKPITWP